MDNSIKFLSKLSGFWAFLALSFIAFLKQCIFPSHYIDSQEYFEYGRWLTNSSFHGFTAQHYLIDYRRTPLYPLFTFCLGNNLKIIALTQFILSCLLPLGLLRIWQNLAFTSKSLNICLWIICSYPIHFYLNVSAMPDFMSEIGLLWFVLYFLEAKYLKSSIIISLMILLKPIFIVVAFLWICWGIWNKVKLKFAMLIPVITYLSWASFNYINFHVFTISSIGDENFYSYNRELILLKNYPQNTVDSIYNSENVQLELLIKDSLKWVKIQKFMSEKNRESIVEFPITTCLLYFKGSLLMFLDPGRYDAMLFWHWPKSKGFLTIKDGNNSSKYPVYQWIYIALFTGLNVLKILLAALGFWSWRKYSHLNFIMLLIVLFCAVCGPVGSARYSVTILPFFAILTTLGIELLRRK